jgi:CheY-like chemotaxis protein
MVDGVFLMVHRVSMARVFVVEDDTDIRNSLAVLLECEGHEVEEASHGLEALTKIRATSQKPDLIVLDLMMPVMDGFQFLEEQIKDPALASIPVLVLSADGNLGSKKSRLNANAFLRKPFELDEFIGLLNQILATKKSNAGLASASSPG